jgi:hypothetical protein
LVFLVPVEEGMPLAADARDARERERAAINFSSGAR